MEKYYGIDNCFVEDNYNDGYYIIRGKDKYLLFYVETVSDFNHYYYLSKLIPFTYQFIRNRFGSFLSCVNGKYFALLSTHSFSLSYSDVLNPYMIGYIIRLNWREQWIKKNKEMWASYFKIKGVYPLIDESIHYYFAILDMAIYSLNDYENFYDYGYVQHIFLKDELFFNPFYYIIDFRERDIASFLKREFGNNKQCFDYYWRMMKGEIQNKKFDYRLVLARLIYPECFLRKLEQIVFFEGSIDGLKDVILIDVDFYSHFFMQKLDD